MNLPARAALAVPPIRKTVPGVCRPPRNRIQNASDQSLSGCEAPIPSTIHGREQAAYFSLIVAVAVGGSGKSGSVDGNGTFIAAIKARNQSIG
jgi:hypothetical protein